MREAPVLLLLLVAAGVRYADIRSDDDVRRAWVLLRGVVVQRQRGTVVELAKPHSGRPEIRLDEGDCGLGVRRIGQPD